MRILGIDYGSKRVGIAVSDETKSFAFPKVVLKNDKSLLNEIRKICQENDIDEVVIGESQNYKMDDNEIMKKIRPFKENLENETGIKTVWEKEFMTSAEAERIQGKNEMLDASASALILKSYLDKQKNKK